MRIPEEDIIKVIGHNPKVLSARALRRSLGEERSGNSHICLLLTSYRKNSTIKGQRHKTFIRGGKFSLTKCRIAKFPFLRCDLGGKRMRNDLRALRSRMDLFCSPPRLCMGTSEIILPSNFFKEDGRQGMMRRWRRRYSSIFNSSLSVIETLRGI
jgi:hypothetical protein